MDFYGVLMSEKLFNSGDFKTISKWKMFFIRIFGKKIVGADFSNGEYNYAISYKFRDKFYFYKMVRPDRITYILPKREIEIW